MFILILTYRKPLDEVEKYMEEHRHYLNKNYDEGHFIASGRQEPRVGGVILCKAENKEQVLRLIQSDPFYIHQIADYQTIEFLPSKYIKGLEKFLK